MGAPGIDWGKGGEGCEGIGAGAVVEIHLGGLVGINELVSRVA